MVPTFAIQQWRLRGYGDRVRRLESRPAIFCGNRPGRDRQMELQPREAECRSAEGSRADMGERWGNRRRPALDLRAQLQQSTGVAEENPIGAELWVRRTL